MKLKYSIVLCDVSCDVLVVRGSVRFDVSLLLKEIVHLSLMKVANFTVLFYCTLYLSRFCFAVKLKYSIVVCDVFGDVLVLRGSVLFDVSWALK